MGRAVRAARGVEEGRRAIALGYIDADIVGMCEVDALGGRNPECFLQLVTMMSEFGYTHQYFDKNGGMTATAIFYK